MGCPCEKSSPFSALSDVIVNSLGQRIVAEPVYISKSKFAKADKLSLLKFAHCADKPSFDKAFGPYFTDTDFTQDDFEKLANLWETGKDKENGFSVERIFGSIDLNLNNLSNCTGIKWTD